MSTFRSFAFVLVLLVGCAQPYAISVIGDDARVRQTHHGVAWDGRLCHESAQYLHQHSLEEPFQRSPREAIDLLLAQFRSRPSRAAAFVLAELFCVEGSRHPAVSEDAAKCHVSSAIFAYACLFDDALPGDGGPFDRRHRMACEIYNQALSNVLARRPLSTSNWSDSKTLTSFAGPVKVVEQSWKLPWPPNQYDRFEIAGRYQVADIDYPSRQQGLGVPLVAFRAQQPAEAQAKADAFLPRNAHQVLPATLCVRFHGSIVTAIQDPSRGMTADITVLDPMVEDAIQIEGRSVPIEANFITPLAFAIDDAPHVSGFKGFMDTTSWGDHHGLYMLHPYQPGKIPVVLVNGLMGKPETWVPMFNALSANEMLRRRYQFWYFMYPTGNPVLYSAAVLRDGLHKAQRIFDPDGTDPAFNQMVIVGHSMGGLVTRLQVTNSGDTLWNALENQPFDSIKAPESSRELIKSVFFFESLPFVKRVVFMATPHRGSALADRWFSEMFSADLKLPEQIRLTTEDYLMPGGMASKPGGDHVPTAVDSLSPENPVLIALEKLPIAPGIVYDSIIPNRKAAGQTGGTDGIVPYASAHLDGAATETIIKSGHGCTRNPDAIYEVSRRLFLHLADVDAGNRAPSRPTDSLPVQPLNASNPSGN